MKRFIVIAGLALGPVAWGQNTSDLMPAAPQPAPGQGAYYPGMPLPPPPNAAGAEGQSQSRGGVSKAGEKPVENRFFYGVDDEGDSEGGTVEGPEQAEAGTHVVKKGDTLWDISATYFHNPYAWPKLWSYNPSITNPHWIYPGNVINLGPPGEPAPLPVAAPATKGEPGRGKMSRSYEQPSGIILRETGFAEPGELQAAGKIVGSPEEKLYLATLDEAYVQFPHDRPVHPGDRLTVFKSIRPLIHPVSKKRLGDVVQIFGDVEVKSVTDSNIARVTVTDSTDTIERGFRVGPLKRQFKLVDPVPNAQDNVGVVVTELHPKMLIGSDVLVIIDRGGKDGVVPGNRFQVVRRGDGYQPVSHQAGPIDDKRFPREVVGQLLILDVRDNVSTGWMQYEIKETHVGDRVEGHRGR